MLLTNELIGLERLSGLLLKSLYYYIRYDDSGLKRLSGLLPYAVLFSNIYY